MLSTVISTFRAVDRFKYMADRDIGEIFLNFMLSEEVRPYCGFDIGDVQMVEEW